MRLLRLWRIGLGASIALSVSLAFATDPVSLYPECTRKPTSADLDGAKGAHKAASQFYDRGDYDKAVRYWSDAYRRTSYYDSRLAYDDYRPAYGLGYNARGANTGTFEQAEAQLSRDWNAAKGASRLTWEQARYAARDAWDRATG